MFHYCANKDRELKMFDCTGLRQENKQGINISVTSEHLAWKKEIDSGTIKVMLRNPKFRPQDGECMKGSDDYEVEQIGE